MRKEWDGSANFPAMTLIEYESWMMTGLDVTGASPDQD